MHSSIQLRKSLGSWTVCNLTELWMVLTNYWLLFKFVKCLNLMSHMSCDFRTEAKLFFGMGETGVFHSKRLAHATFLNI